MGAVSFWVVVGGGSARANGGLSAVGLRDRGSRLHGRAVAVGAVSFWVVVGGVSARANDRACEGRGVSARVEASR